MSARQVAVVGDRFMLPQAFVEALNGIDGADLAIRTHQLAWPDEPMQGGGSRPGLEGLKEFMGDPDEIAEFIGDAEILIDHLAPVSGPMLERLPQLKLVAVSRGGPVNLDMKALRAKGIKVVNTPGRNAPAVAEFTIGAILAETRLITRGHEALRKGEWRGDLYRADLTGDELCDCTVGVIGYGHIGTRVVRYLKPFGCRILVHDPFVELSETDRADGVEAVGFDDLLERADIVTLHARVTKETTGFLGPAQFARMKEGSFFINTARGPMVDYPALTEALRSGHLRGAMLETFGTEPVPADWPLLHLPNVTLTPHIAGASRSTIRLAARMVAREVELYLAGKPPVNPVE